LVALFILGKMYIANAGDSRAVLCKSRHPIPMSNDFTPETERQRVRQLVSLPFEVKEVIVLFYCLHCLWSLLKIYVVD